MLSYLINKVKNSSNVARKRCKKIAWISPGENLSGSLKGKIQSNPSNLLIVEEPVLALRSSIRASLVITQRSKMKMMLSKLLKRIVTGLKTIVML